MAILLRVTTAADNAFGWHVTHQEVLGMLTSLFNTEDINDKAVNIQLLEVASNRVTIETTLGRLIASGIEKIATDVPLSRKRLDNLTACTIALEGAGKYRENPLQRFSDFRQILMMLDTLGRAYHLTSKDGVFPAHFFPDIQESLRRTS